MDKRVVITTFPLLPPRGLQDKEGDEKARLKLFNAEVDRGCAFARAAMWDRGHGGELARMPFFDAAILRIEFQMPDQAERDLDKLIKGCKAWIDGCIVAGVLASDDWRSLRGVAATAVYAPNHPLTTLTFVEVGENDNIA